MTEVTGIQSAKLMTIQLLSAVSGWLEEGGDENLSGDRLLPYEDDIRAEIFRMGQGKAEDLMEHYRGMDEVTEKVRSAICSVKEADGELKMCAVLDMEEDLSEDGWKNLKQFLSDQYEEGWGECLFQRGIGTNDGTLHVTLGCGPDCFTEVRDVLPGIYLAAAAAKSPAVLGNRDECWEIQVPEICLGIFEGYRKTEAKAKAEAALRELSNIKGALDPSLVKIQTLLPPRDKKTRVKVLFQDGVLMSVLAGGKAENLQVAVEDVSRHEEGTNGMLSRFADPDYPAELGGAL